MSDADLADTVRRVEPEVQRALRELPVLPAAVEDARTLLARCRIELRRRGAAAGATRVGWIE